MNAHFVRITTGLLCALLSAPVVSAQSSGDALGSSVGLRVGYFSPLGDWAQSPVAPSVHLVGGGVAVELDFDFALGERWTLGLEGGYADLNGSAWEEYAARFGDRLEISGTFIHAAVLLRPQLLASAPNILRLEIGPAVLFASGEELFEGRTYPYDFLGGTSLGVQGGLEYIRLITESMALSVKVSGLYFPGASQHASATGKAITFVPVTAGLRFVL